MKKYKSLQGKGQIQGWSLSEEDWTSQAGCPSGADILRGRGVKLCLWHLFRVLDYPFLNIALLSAITWGIKAKSHLNVYYEGDCAFFFSRGVWQQFQVSVYIPTAD